MKKRLSRLLIILVSGVCLGWGLTFVSSGWAQASDMRAGAQDLTGLSYKEGGPPSTFLDYWSQGGPTMWPLLAALIWTTAVALELIIKLRLKYFCPPDVVSNLHQSLQVKDYQKAWRQAMETPSPLSTIFSKAIEKLPLGKEAVELAAAEAAADVNSIYRNKNSYISLNAAITPLMGLFGTISGMVGAFNSMAYAGAVGDPTKLAGDIGEALITTYAGLVIAIPAFVLFYVLGNRLRQMLATTQGVMNDLFDLVDFNALPEVVVTSSMKAELQAGSAPAAAPAPAKPAAECPQCKAAISVGMKACPQCGAEIEWE